MYLANDSDLDVQIRMPYLVKRRNPSDHRWDWVWVEDNFTPKFSKGAYNSRYVKVGGQYSVNPVKYLSFRVAGYSSGSQTLALSERLTIAPAGGVGDKTVCIYLVGTESNPSISEATTCTDGPPPKYTWNGTHVWLINQSNWNGQGIHYRYKDSSGSWSESSNDTVSPFEKVNWDTQISGEYRRNPVQEIQLTIEGRTISITPAGHDGEKTVCVYVTGDDANSPSISDATSCAGPPAEYTWGGTRVWIVNQSNRAVETSYRYQNRYNAWSDSRSKTIAVDQNDDWYTKHSGQYSINIIKKIKLTVDGEEIFVTPAGHDGDKTVCIYVTDATGTATANDSSASGATVDNPANPAYEVVGVATTSVSVATTSIVSTATSIANLANALSISAPTNCDGPPPRYTWSGTRVWLVNQTARNQSVEYRYLSRSESSWSSISRETVSAYKNSSWYTKISGEHGMNPVKTIWLKVGGRDVYITPAGHDGDKTACVYVTTTDAGNISVSDETSCSGPPQYTWSNNTRVWVANHTDSSQSVNYSYNDGEAWRGYNATQLASGGNSHWDKGISGVYNESPVKSIRVVAAGKTFSISPAGHGEGNKELCLYIKGATSFEGPAACSGPPRAKPTPPRVSTNDPLAGLRDAVNAVVGAVKNAVNAVKKAVKKAANGIGRAVRNAGRKIGRTVRNIGRKIGSFFGSLF